MCIVTFCTYTCGHKVQQGELEPGALLLGLDCDRTVPRFLAGTTVNVCADCSLKNQMGTVVAAGRYDEPLSQEIKDFISGRGPPPAPAEVRPDILAFLNRIGAAGGFSNNYHASSEGSAEVVTAAAAVDGNSQEDAFLQSRHTSDKTGSDTSYDGGPLQHLHALVADTGLGEPKEIEDKERKRKGKETAPSVSSDPGSSNASYPSFEGFASDAGSSDREVPLVQYLAVNSEASSINTTSDRDPNQKPTDLIELEPFTWRQRVLHWLIKQQLHNAQTAVASRSTGSTSSKHSSTSPSDKRNLGVPMLKSKRSSMYPKLMSPLRLLSPALPLTLRFSIAVTHHQTVDNLFESIKEAKNHEQHPSQTNDDGEKLSNAPRTESSALGDPVYPAVSPDPAISSAQHTHHNSEQICWDARPRARITRAERAAAWASGRLRAVIPAPTVPNNHETLGRVAEAGASVAVAELHSIRPPKTQHLTHHSIRTIPAHVSDHEDIFPTGSSQSLHPQTPRPPPPKENRAGPLKSPAPHIYPLPGRTLATELLLAGENLRTLFLSPLKSQSPCQTAVREVGFTGTGLYLMPAHIVSDGVRIVKSDRRLCFRRGVGELGAPRRGGEEVD